MTESLAEINIDLDTNKIHEWRSIVTLIVFVLTNVVVLFPFHIPLPFPRVLYNAILDALGRLRIIPPRKRRSRYGTSSVNGHGGSSAEEAGFFVTLHLLMNFVTAPLIADLFLLAILAIGRDEVYGGTIGANNISPIDIMAFFITLAYIAISIDASGLIRYLTFIVLQKGGKYGHRLFGYLYAFFFCLGAVCGNDPIILSGTAFLAYMTRVSSNIIHPRAWIFSQFAVANIASAILVSSNPTNLVLAGAFDIRFVDYTANMVVPVLVTAAVLYFVLLYVVFANESLIPQSIQMHELSEEAKSKRPVNPNIPHARGTAEEKENDPANGTESKQLSLEEIMNPFIDKFGAGFGATIMIATLVTILAINAASQDTGEHPVFYVTLPAAFVMFCWDILSGWLNRHETRKIARDGRREVEQARAERQAREAEEAGRPSSLERDNRGIGSQSSAPDANPLSKNPPSPHEKGGSGPSNTTTVNGSVSGADTQEVPPSTIAISALDENHGLELRKASRGFSVNKEEGAEGVQLAQHHVDTEKQPPYDVTAQIDNGHATLVSLVANAYRWSQETFPTATVVLSHLPFALVPFAFSMFVLVQALVTKGWVPVFAYGWDHWVRRTGTIGSVGGMGFLSVVLCNFAGTNIGTTILLSRVIQAWQKINQANGNTITSRNLWATIYSMALGVNYGAFSTAFSASLAGLLWRDILARKHIHVRRLDFARVNLPIITVAMAIGCAILIGEVYIFRKNEPYDAPK
ncbi:hypothetical protein GGR52DRAFT_580393 [Hypoxylon sp. FL1284]|nr:hypothetical protein GGR52DRAFT_580393 [Hypoxylon sp. FL1284]